jgi:hypothetical protein
MRTRRYHYVGPAELRDVAIASDILAVHSREVLDGWLSERDGGELAEPFTFVVDLDVTLRLAPRRSEHVALARGRDVLAAGEITFASTEVGWYIVEVTNQSTGYCPDPDSWPAVAAALDRVRVRHPGNFTHAIIFRRCPSCRERNIVRDHEFTCALCDGVLPAQWNFTTH